MSTHSSGWTEHETNCSKVCSSSLEQWPARPSGSGVHWAAQSRHDPNFLSRIITGDESWLYDYDLETKQQSSQLKTPSSPWPKKARQVRSNIKWMLIIFFFDIQGIVHKSLFHLVRLSMGCFTASFWDDWGKMWGANGLRCGRTDWLLHHDNAPAHTLLVVREFLTNNNMTTVPHPAYSPDLAPCDFYVFLKWNSSWKGGVLYPLKCSKQNRNRY